MTLFSRLYSCLSFSLGFHNAKNDLSREDACSNASRCPTYNISISAPGGQTRSVGDKGEWSEVNNLLKEVSDEMEIDAKKAINDLKKDNELWERVQRLKADRKASGKSREENSETHGKQLYLLQNNGTLSVYIFFIYHIFWILPVLTLVTILY